MRKPVPYFEETEKFTSIFNKLQNIPIAILYCYGLPGNGKSEIVRMLAKNFPFVGKSNPASKNVIKCHIQCKDSGDKINTELKELVKKLKAYLNKDELQNIQKDIDKGLSKSLVQTFVKLSYPVVLVIEDPELKENSQNNTKNLLESLLWDIVECKKENLKSKIHIYVTSCVEPLVDSKESSQILNNNEVFMKERVEGFNEKETFRFLCFYKSALNDNEVIEAFQDLQIRLKQTKVYYIDCKYEFPKYIQLEFNINTKEDEWNIEDKRLKEIDQKIKNNQKIQNILEHFGLLSKCSLRCIKKTKSCENVLKLIFKYNKVEQKKDDQNRSKEKQKLSFSEKARELHRRFSGLPLCLFAAKGFCADTGLEYDEYLDYWEELHIDKSKKIEIKEALGDSAEYVLQSITSPFRKLKNGTSTAPLDWKVLSCLLYFNYDRIPRFAIEYCFHVLREKETKYVYNKKDAGAFINKLWKYNLCSKTSNDEITFHQVVSKAFMIYQQSSATKEFNPLEMAIEIMCGLISKDMRQKVQCEKICQLRRHIQILLFNINKYEKDLFNKERGNTLLLKALVSYLYETAAAIMLHVSPRLLLKERYFEISVKYVWEEKLFERNGEFSNKLVKSIIEKSKEKGEKLSNDFTLDFVSKLFFHREEMEFLKFKASECFERIDITKPIISHKKFLLQNLRSKEFFLSNKQYAPFFYAERIASILHSWSCLGSFADSDRSLDIDYLWMSWMSIQITSECRERYKVRLLTEYLSRVGGQIPIVLHDENSTIENLNEVLSFCKDALKTKETGEKVYENGLVKEMHGSLSTKKQIYLLKCIVRLNIRLIKLSTQYLHHKADDYCTELLKLSLENATVITSCSSCIIYCAKYYFKKENYKSSLNCFQKYFDLLAKPNYKPKFKEECWSIFNYAKLVNQYSSKSIEQIKEAVRMCETVLNDKEEISQHLTIGLQNQLLSLQTCLKMPKT